MGAGDGNRTRTVSLGMRAGLGPTSRVPGRPSNRLTVNAPQAPRPTVPSGTQRARPSRHEHLGARRASPGTSLKTAPWPATLVPGGTLEVPQVLPGVDLALHRVGAAELPLLPPPPNATSQPLTDRPAIRRDGHPQRRWRWGYYRPVRISAPPSRAHLPSPAASRPYHKTAEATSADRPPCLPAVRRVLERLRPHPPGTRQRAAWLLRHFGRSWPLTSPQR